MLNHITCHPKIINLNTHTCKHFKTDQCKPPTAIIAPEPQLKCYDLKFTTFLPTVPLRLSSLVCSSPASPFLTKAARSALSRSPMSGAFSMALNAMLPYFIEHVVGWCWIPPQSLAMGSCIRDVSFGTRAGGGWKENIKDEGDRLMFLCCGGLCRSRCYFAFQYELMLAKQRKNL